MIFVSIVIFCAIVGDISSASYNLNPQESLPDCSTRKKLKIPSFRFLGLQLTNMVRTLGAHTMSIDVRNAILRGIEQGMKQTELARLFHVHKSTICHFLKRFSADGVIAPAPIPGRSRMTSRLTDRNILRLSRGNPRLTSTDIQRELAVASEQIPSTRTIRRRLQAAGLNGRRPAKKPLISEKNRGARVRWAQEHIGWTRQQWNNVLFSDESKFNLMGSDGIKYIRRPLGRRFDPLYQLPTVKHGGGNVMIWGCFSGHGIGPLRQIHGDLDRYGYEDILETTMRPFALQNSAEKFAQLEEAWKSIPQSFLDTLLDSMPRRCQAVIDAKGFATKY
ncbi:transposase [Ostertagia ostertagi]